MKYLIDGIDRLGKSTLINHILDEQGYHLVVHYDKPKLLDTYRMYNVDGRLADLSDNAAKRIYQEQCNQAMFELMNSDAPIIFDRTHLGEMVYAPLYRDYSGEYVYDEEAHFVFNHPKCEDVVLILLTTSDFSIMKDDGLSFDFTKRAEEQAMFVKAFDRSMLPKIVIDVHNGSGGYKNAFEVYEEVMQKIAKK